MNGLCMNKKAFAVIYLMGSFLRADEQPREHAEACLRMGGILKNFGTKVLYINLEECTERGARMEALSKDMNLPMERINACNPDDVVRDNPEWVLLMNDPFYGTFIKKMLCQASTMSHYKAIKEGIASGAPVVLIVEDDICLAPNLKECCDMV